MSKTLPTLDAVLNATARTNNTKRMEQIKRGEVRRNHASYKRIVAVLCDKNITNELDEETIRTIHMRGEQCVKDIALVCEECGFDNPLDNDVEATNEA